MTETQVIVQTAQNDGAATAETVTVTINAPAVTVTVNVPAETVTINAPPVTVTEVAPAPVSCLARSSYCGFADERV